MHFNVIFPLRKKVTLPTDVYYLQTLADNRFYKLFCASYFILVPNWLID